MRNKTQEILQKIPISNTEPTKRFIDPFIMKAVKILIAIPEGDRHTTLHSINELGNSAVKEYHRTIITILNDRFLSFKPEKLSVSAEELETTVNNEASPISGFPGFKIQQLMTENKTSLDLSSLEDTLIEISTLQSTLGQHLQEQGERISVLNVDADAIDQNLDLGNLELQKSIIQMSKSRSWFVYTLCILSSVLIAIDWFYD
eukprot:NODE_226_length_13883_cov_0.528729.p7 type:complete len:203 gc:universal NODE_226_length_13883_cov_0.528729:9440-10048(+)